VADLGRSGERAFTCCSLALLALSCGHERETGPPPPPVVSVGTVTQRDVPIYIEFAGTLDAYVNAEVRARVEGILLAQHYREGSFVKAGQLLFTIDPAPLRAAQLQAEGALEQAKAALEKAEADIARYRPLVEKRAATKEQLDNALAARRTAIGQVQGARGSLDLANLRLGYTRVTAPVDGIVDIARERVGNLVGQGTPTLLTTVSSVDPIRFVFHISERAYLQYSERIKQLTEGQIPESDPGRALELVLANEQPYLHRGYAAIVARQVDPTTGTLELQALFPNPDMLLRPGQYARARFTDILPSALLIPQRAVRDVQGQSQVAVVLPDGKADVRTVKLGPVTGGFVVVEEGLSPGERIVVDGVQKARAGQPVTPTPADTSMLQLSSASVEVQTAPQPRTDGGRIETAPTDGGGPPARGSTAPHPNGR
jgi:membrane fusion protein (multidrug efflux system)